MADLDCRTYGLNQEHPMTITENSVFDHLHRACGDIESKVATLSVNNGTQSINLFQITGTVQILKIYGFITAKTTLTNLTGAHLDVYDGTIDTDITKASPGATLSGMAVGTYFAKTGLASVDLAVSNNATTIVAEATGNKLFSESEITQKLSTNTFIRFHYASTDTPINAQLTLYCEWRGMDGGTLVAV